MPDLYRDVRDRGFEMLLKSIYNPPMFEALTGLRAPYADARKPRPRDEHAERTLKAKIEAIKTREEEGGLRRRSPGSFWPTPRPNA